jgi:hypothetical protein
VRSGLRAASSLLVTAPSSDLGMRLSPRTARSAFGAGRPPVCTPSIRIMQTED